MRSNQKVIPQVLAYIREEVRRQGHDLSNPVDGGARVEWMADAWLWAQEKAVWRARPTLADILTIAKMIEPNKNADGLRRVGVRVGPHIKPDPREVPDLLDRLLEHGQGLAPMEFYYQFEMIHPFVDGNGRTGKVLLAWLAESWDAPFFPPSDLFGYPIENP